MKSKENDVLIHFKEKTAIPVGLHKGKIKHISIPPHEYIDLDKKTGMFYVKNVFTNGKIKYTSSDSEENFMSLNYVRIMLEKYKKYIITDQV